MNSSAREVRGIGRTTRQMLAAPPGATYIWCTNKLAIPDDMLRRLNRLDIRLKSPSWLLSQNNFRGLRGTAIVLDHAVVLPQEISMYGLQGWCTQCGIELITLDTLINRSNNNMSLIPTNTQGYQAELPHLVELKHLNKDVPYPTRATPGSAAYDLHAAIDTAIELYPGECKLVPTGISIHINSPALAAAILPRSKLGHKGLVVGNLMGLIDSDYTGEIYVSCWNRNSEDGPVITIEPYSSIAQLLFVYVPKVAIIEVDEFTAASWSKRGDGGISKNEDTKA